VVSTSVPDLIVLRPEHHVTLGPADFGMEGLTAVESVGPFTGIQASGPLITVHDSVVDAGLGIGHHPHRFNERLFYIERGQLDHDDARNDIQGHMDTGDVGQFTEGRRGMIHSEWNHGAENTRAFILVYSTDPIPETTAFNALRDADAPRSEEAPGVLTKELVGPRSPLRVNGDIRLYTDSTLDTGSVLEIHLEPGEGGLVSVREGSTRIDEADERLQPGDTLLAPVADHARRIRLHAEEPTRVIRVVHGPGHGFVRAAPMPRRADR
jgi:redox-sensitive bicupin YhaK (pirin superfamily)